MITWISAWFADDIWLIVSSCWWVSGGVAWLLVCYVWLRWWVLLWFRLIVRLWWFMGTLV